MLVASDVIITFRYLAVKFDDKTHLILPLPRFVVLQLRSILEPKPIAISEYVVSSLERRTRIPDVTVEGVVVLLVEIEVLEISDPTEVIGYMIVTVSYNYTLKDLEAEGDYPEDLSYDTRCQQVSWRSSRNHWHGTRHDARGREIC